MGVRWSGANPVWQILGFRYVREDVRASRLRFSRDLHIALMNLVQDVVRDTQSFAESLFRLQNAFFQLPECDLEGDLIKIGLGNCEGEDELLGLFGVHRLFLSLCKYCLELTEQVIIEPSKPVCQPSEAIYCSNSSRLLSSSAIFLKVPLPKAVSTVRANGKRSPRIAACRNKSFIGSLSGSEEDRF